MAQKDLEGNDTKVETSEEDKHYNIWETEKLIVKYSDEALEKVRADKDAEQKIQRKVRIKADAKILPGEWDRESKKLVGAVRKGY
jgi:hypothetical protein